MLRCSPAPSSSVVKFRSIYSAVRLNLSNSEDATGLWSKASICQNPSNFRPRSGPYYELSPYPSPPRARALSHTRHLSARSRSTPYDAPTLLRATVTLTSRLSSFHSPSVCHPVSTLGLRENWRLARAFGFARVAPCHTLAELRHRCTVIGRLAPIAVAIMLNDAERAH